MKETFLPSLISLYRFNAYPNINPSAFSFPISLFLFNFEDKGINEIHVLIK